MSTGHKDKVPQRFSDFLRSALRHLFLLSLILCDPDVLSSHILPLLVPSEEISEGEGIILSGLCFFFRAALSVFRLLAAVLAVGILFRAL